MVDIHTHIIPDVDDGSDALSKSIALLKEEAEKGVTAVCLTPHLRRGQFELSSDFIRSEFLSFKAAAEKENIPVKLYLGREIHIYGELIEDLKKGEVITLGNGNCVLLEFPYTEKTDIDEICYETALCGYTPVIAHVERYEYFRDVGKVAKVRRAGAKIQVNARSLLNAFCDGCAFAKKLLKEKLIDAVASDVHYGRKNGLKEAYEKVKKRDAEYAEKIFSEVPSRILGI